MLFRQLRRQDGRPNLSLSMDEAMTGLAERDEFRKIGIAVIIKNVMNVMMARAFRLVAQAALKLVAFADKTFNQMCERAIIRVRVNSTFPEWILGTDKFSLMRCGYFQSSIQGEFSPIHRMGRPELSKIRSRFPIKIISLARTQPGMKSAKFWPSLRDAALDFLFLSFWTMEFCIRFWPIHGDGDASRATSANVRSAQGRGYGLSASLFEFRIRPNLFTSAGTAYPAPIPQTQKPFAFLAMFHNHSIYPSKGYYHIPLSDCQYSKLTF
jgi:hypothetical protein